MKTNFTNKITSPIGVVFFVFLLVSISSLLIYFRDIGERKQELISDAGAKTISANQFINDEFSSILQDIYFYSLNPAYGEYLIRQTPDYSDIVVEKTSSAFLKIRQSYLQFTLIDTLGNERMTVEFDGEQATTLNVKSNIEGSKEFQNFKLLKRGEVNISDFENYTLNDGSKTMATIRFTMPLFLRGSEAKVGYVRLSYSGDRVFSRFNSLYRDEAEVYLLNEDKKFIVRPNNTLVQSNHPDSNIVGPNDYYTDLNTSWEENQNQIWEGMFGLVYCSKLDARNSIEKPESQKFFNYPTYYLFINYQPSYIGGLDRKLALDLFLYALLIMVVVIPTILYLLKLLDKKNRQLRDKTKALEFRNKDLEDSRTRMEKNIERIREYAFQNNKTVSELKRKERDLKKAQKIAQLGYYDRDLVTGKSSWSDNLPEIFGLPDDYDFNTQSIKAIMKPEEFEEVEVAFAEAIEEKREFKAIFRVFHKDGKREYLQDIAQPLIENGEVIAMKGTIQNLTERINIEKELLSAKLKAEDAVRVKSDFLATMSHEIRTPLNAVLGMAGLLSETNLDNSQSDFVQTIKVSGNALLGVINDILDFSKIESGQMTLENLPIDLNQMIEDCLQVVSVSAARKKLKLFYKIDLDVPDIIYGDEGRLRQSLINLLNNGVKFTDRGEVEVIIGAQKLAKDKVKLKVSIIDTGIGIEADKQDSIFSAFQQADTSITRKFGGSGLGLAITQKLIQFMGGSLHLKSEVDIGSEFYFYLETGAEWKKKDHNLKVKTATIISAQSNEKTMLSETLSGFGVKVQELDFEEGDLSKVDGEVIFILCEPEWRKEFIQLGESLKAMHDRLYFITNLQKGLSQFKSFDTVSRPVRLSWIKEVLFEDDSNKGLAPDGNTAALNILPKDLNILVAEDNPVNQKLITLLFENLGYHIDLAENGVLAVKAAQNKKYDLVFMDIQMPQMGGVEASKYIKEDHGENAPKIIALTANALDGDKDKYLKAGLDDYLSKPINVEELKDKIRQWSA